MVCDSSCRSPGLALFAVTAMGLWNPGLLDPQRLGSPVITIGSDVDEIPEGSFSVR